jgi:hypothetical protein
VFLYTRVKFVIGFCAVKFARKYARIELNYRSSCLTLSYVYFKTTFRRLDSLSVFRENLLSWAPSPGIGISSIDWAQVNRFYLKTETESSLRNVIFWNINRTMFLDKNRTLDNVQKQNICNMTVLLNFRLLPSSSWILECLIILLWSWRRHVPPKRLLTSNGLHGVKCYKI